MSSDTQGLLNGHPRDSNHLDGGIDTAFESLNARLKNAEYVAKFHGDELLADKQTVHTGTLTDIRDVLTFKNLGNILKVATNSLTGKGLDVVAGAPVIASFSDDSGNRSKLIETQVKDKYEKMLHPPLTYLGDAFQYRASDGKFNSVLHPHLGQAGAPYAKTVPSKTHPLGALPDPGDIFDRLMARDASGRDSKSGLSSMLLYHATIIIHDIFRTNDSDKNISDSSSYLDLSPLYGYTEKMTRSIRDDKYKLGLLKPDTFAEDRLVRQPPGVCIMLVMYNRYHNYAATQLRRINENGRFEVPEKFRKARLVATAEGCVESTQNDQKFKEAFKEALNAYEKVWKAVAAHEKAWKALDAHEKAWTASDSHKKAWKAYWELGPGPFSKEGEDTLKEAKLKEATAGLEENEKDQMKGVVAGLTREDKAQMENVTAELKKFMTECDPSSVRAFENAYDAAWDKLDDDLFNTARLITCGIYVNISIHDYLRALMGFHEYDTNFTLDPRIAMTEHKNVSRGIGNQVTVEFNLLYRFHCAISQRDESFTEEFMKEMRVDYLENQERKGKPKDYPAWDQSKRKDVAAEEEVATWDPKAQSLNQFLDFYRGSALTPKAPWVREFGLRDNEEYRFDRNTFTGLFDDQQMITHLLKSMDDPISNFGPRNVPKALKSVELLGIHQARKWEVGTLNDFRDFFGMKRHSTFEDITKNLNVQHALRDLYDHPDKVELYPGVFCESNEEMGLDPGPSKVDSALWAAIFSDAITLVRSDRFYTVDWNTNSLTSWGMKEVTPDNEVLKSSVFHRLIQRAFPEWFPYDSVRFFHPFYTSQKNADLARVQGYSAGFKMAYDTRSKPKYNIQASNPRKPPKPVYLSEYDDVAALLAQKPDTIINPILTNTAALPVKVAEVLMNGPVTSKVPQNYETLDDEGKTMTYFTELMREVIQREIITVDSGDRPIYQIDVTRDLAIPVITRFIADFLGFTDQIRINKDSIGKFSENEIYQHITNCQVFLAYNADETKMLKRRDAFKKSMKFLFDLAENGHVRQANKWRINRSVPTNHMAHLGRRVAEKILEQERNDVGRTTAILLLTALDSAYNSVLAFTAVLNHFLDGLYNLPSQEEERSPKKERLPKPVWLEIQALALKDVSESDKAIQTLVLDAQRESVQLPVVRQATADVVVKDDNGEQIFRLIKGQIVVCDIHRAMENKMKKLQPGKKLNPEEYLTYGSSLSQGFVHFNPKKTAILGLTAMVKVLAQMKNIRRGHDAQGRLKKVRIDQTYEGYANFMAPMRMTRIERDVKLAKAKEEEEAEKKRKTGTTVYEDQKLKKDLANVFDVHILKPSTETFLTAEWDEMIPFPTTWKVRFDGYGKSDYGKDFALLRKDKLPDDFPPFYQPQGASHFGGSFADNTIPKMPADSVHTKLPGCGAPAGAPVV